MMTIGVDVRGLVQDAQDEISRLLWAWFSEWPSFGLPHYVVAFGNQRTEFDHPCWRHPMFTALRLKEWNIPWRDRPAFKRAVERERLDLFISPTVHGPLGLTCPSLVGMIDAVDLADLEFRGWRRRAAREAMKRRAEESWKVYTRSQAAKRELVAQFGVAEEKIAVIPDVVRDGFLPRPRHQSCRIAAERWGIGEPYAVCAGTVLPHQNAAGAVRAYAALSPERRKEMRLVLRGGGRGAADVKREVERRQLSSRVTWLDFVSVEDLPDLYSAASVCVYPAWHDGFGLPPLEAMACGAPVVASPRGALPEILGEAPRYADPADPAAAARAMEDIVSSGELRDAMRLKGFQRAARYSAVNSVSGLLDVLEAFRLDRLAASYKIPPPDSVR